MSTVITFEKRRRTVMPPVASTPRRQLSKGFVSASTPGDVVTLANKLQVLVLERPISAREVEKLIDRLLKMTWD